MDAITDTNESEEVQELRAEMAELREEIVSLQSRNDALSDEVDGLSADLENAPEDSADLIEKVDSFLDECERPVGQLRFIVPQTPATERAILALFDALGRDP